MKNLSDLLRQADPLQDDSQRLDKVRNEMRRTVVAAASMARPLPGRAVPRRFILAAAAATLVALTIAGVLGGSGDRAALQAAVRFEVRLAETEPVPGLVVARLGDSGRVIYLHPEMIVTNDDIAQSWVRQDGPDRFGVSVELLEAGAQRMREATANHLGRPVAIMIDGVVVSAPIVRSEISNSAMITGDFTQSEAERIVEGIGVR